MNIANVSVVIPTYNSESTIERAVKSVANQTILPKEVIIVDDCSTSKNIKNILSKIKLRYQNKFDVILIYLNKNLGPGIARNIGWNKAKCKYIAFLDSDDVWHPQKLEIQYFYMENNNIDFICNNAIILEENKLNDFYNSKILLEDLGIKKINPFIYLFKHVFDGGTPSVMLRNINDIRFVDGKRYSEDYCVWLEYNFKYRGVVINKELIALFKEFYGVGGLSNNLWLLEKGELENFKILYDKGYYGLFIFLLAYIWSLIKYFRRVIICLFR